MGIDKFIVGHPQRVGDAAYSFEMVDVTCSYHKFDVDCLGHLSHCGSYGFLVIISVTPGVVHKVEVERLLQCCPFGSRVVRFLPVASTARICQKRYGSEQDCQMDSHDSEF